MSQSTRINRSAADAWSQLVKSGALDIDGRDKEFAETVCKMLDPTAADLADALAKATTDQLIKVFFRALQPFSEMYREILRFFKTAGAKYGRDQWRIGITDEHLELSDFEDFLRMWDGVPGEIDVPAVGQEDFGVVWLAWEAYPQLGNLANRAAREPAELGIADVDQWLIDYRSGQINPLPLWVLSKQQDAGFRELAAMVATVHESLVAFSQNRAILRSQFDWQTLKGSDAFSVNHLAFLDTDNWLGTAVAGLALTVGIAPENRNRIGRVLRNTLDGLPTRKLNASVSLNDLDRFLSLPVWQKRHEIYAVWLFSEMAVAANEHDLEIHHDQGRIAFEFREARLATVTSARPPIDMITERRSPVANPVGAGRTANVQPDFGIWARDPGSERCVLVVEVKHYKRTEKRSFSEVMTDYATAHPDARIVLVNYGPIGDILDRISLSATGRCTTIEHLTALNRTAREEFRELVRKVIGRPVRAALVIGGTTRAKSAVAVDVSPSMAPVLSDPRFISALAAIAVTPRASEIFPIDRRVHTAISVDGAVERLRCIQGDINALEGPVTELLGTYEEVIVFTDRDGLNDLSALKSASEEFADGGLFQVTVCRPEPT